MRREDERAALLGRWAGSGDEEEEERGKRSGGRGGVEDLIEEREAH